MTDPDAKIVPLRGSLMPTAPTCDPVVVSAIEGLLAQAMAGEITGIAYAAIHPGDMTSFHRVGRGTRALIGAIELLKFDICAAERKE